MKKLLFISIVIFVGCCKYECNPQIDDLSFNFDSLKNELNVIVQIKNLKPNSAYKICIDGIGETRNLLPDGYRDSPTSIQTNSKGELNGTYKFKSLKNGNYNVKVGLKDNKYNWCEISSGCEFSIND